jgi:hypothetical protein
VAPGKSVDITASYTGLVGPGYAFVDWGDGKGPQPVQLTTTGTGNNGFSTNGTISAHYNNVPAGGLSGTLWLYDMHGLKAMQNFNVFCTVADDITLKVGEAQDDTLFTPIFLRLPQDFDVTNATFTLTYSASDPNDDSFTQSTTGGDPWTFTPAAGNFAL